ncbi:flagellar motor protein MotB [Sinomonas sp. JGH33]|uniref:Flagellar motor protein MotB n=1 Tax=Sinomonas terricola TaxID=3110330 RepID=A0ABU5T504_9MICC|nr:flagellar motor protein MotB [Sinomonas sp. JGH33]MEA5454755.1 flagellar motor protein MotB [Sinomonas sp. JGH33]
MSRRRRRPLKKPEAFHVDERWAVSYMDMITVLFCLFVVLFAMSAVDQNKFEKLRNSLATGFGTTVTDKIDTASGTVVPPDKAKRDTEGFTNLDLALKEVDRLTALMNQMNAKLTAEGLAQDVQFQIDQRGLTVKLVGSQTFFEPDQSSLTLRADQVLDAVTPVIVPTPLEVSVEGHAANLITAYPSVWELSSERATKVLRYMVERDGLPGTRIGATGFGAARPANPDQTEAEHEQNRRVDVVVLSDQPETVRALIPEALKARVAGK